MSERRLLSTTLCLLTFAGGTALVAGGACMEPTQVTLDIQYHGGSCKEMKDVVVMVGSDPNEVEGRINAPSFYPTALTTNCVDGKVGTLVLTPSDVSDKAAIVVIAGIGVPAESCKADTGYLHCVIARRQINFIDHLPVTLPMILERTCANVPCNAISSCKDGRCASSVTSCKGEDCSEFGATLVPDAPTRPPNTDTLCQPIDRELACGDSVCHGEESCCYALGGSTVGSIRPLANPVPEYDASEFDASVGTSSGTSGTSGTSGSSGTSGTSSGTSGTTGTSSSSGTSGTSSGTSGTSGSSGTSGTSTGLPPADASSGSPGGGTPTCGLTCSPALSCFGRDNCTAATPFCCIVNTTTMPATICQETACTGDFACHENCDCPEGFVCDKNELGPHLHRCIAL